MANLYRKETQSSSERISSRSDCEWQATSSDVIHLRPVLRLAQVGDGDLFENLFGAFDGARPGFDQPASGKRSRHAIARTSDLDAHQRTFQNLQHFGHADFLRRPRETITAAWSARAVDEIGALQEHHDLSEVLVGYALPPGDLLDLRELPSLAVLREIDKREQPVVAFGADLHGMKHLHDGLRTSS